MYTYTSRHALASPRRTEHQCRGTISKPRDHTWHCTFRENVEGRSNLSIPKIMTDWRSIPKKKVCFVLRIDCNQGSLGSQETWLLDLMIFSCRMREVRSTGVFGLELIGTIWKNLGNKKGISLDWLKLIQVPHFFRSCFTNLLSNATRWEGEVILLWTRFKCSF